MIHPIPPGTRDVLPDEMRELRKLHVALIEVFEGFGYGEVATPAIEYDEVLARGDGRSTGSGYRFFDESGDLLALRAEMTVPIARLAASRYAAAEEPVRLCYLANAFRAVRPQRGQEDRRLDLGARDGRRDVDRPERGATDHRDRRKGVVRSGVERRTHRAQRLDDTSDRTASQ